MKNRQMRKKKSCTGILDTQKNQVTLLKMGVE